MAAEPLTPPAEGHRPEVLVEVTDLHVSYRSRDGDVPAVRGVTLELRAGEILALLGESASGKSTVGLSILGLLPESAETQGEIAYRGQSLSGLTQDELRKLRGREIGMIFQDALSSLTPTMTVGDQLAEVFRTHMGLDVRAAREAALDTLAEVLPAPERIMDSYPFQMSGGMAQRVMIAMATALKPSVIIADEPTSSLDPAVRQDTLERIEALRNGGTSVLLITHDFGVVARLADRVNVMYAGQLVEDVDVMTVFRQPRHPYTYGLLRSLPSIAGRGELTPMKGNPPDLATLPPECPFLPRCNKAISVCRVEPAPPLLAMDTGPDHRAACYNPIAVALRD